MGILKRIVRMVVGTALILLSLALLCTCPILRLTGKDAESFLADADFQVTDSLEVARDDLLHSQDFDRAAIEAAGVDLSEGHVVPLLGAMETAARGFTDGDLSLAELARGALLAQQLLPTAGKLDSTEATEGLFDTLGIEEYYGDFKDICANQRHLILGALIGFDVLLGLLVFCALGSLLQTLFGRGKGFDVALLVLELLLLGLFCGAAFLGRPLLQQLGVPVTARLALVLGRPLLLDLGLPATVDLSLGLLPLLAPVGVILAMALKYVMPKVHARLAALKDVAFYIWGCSLTMVTGITMRVVFAYLGHPWLVFSLVVAALLICVMKFGLGKAIGSRTGKVDKISAGQAFGQKNTMFTIWMALSWLSPVAAVAPGSYVIWQNIINSYQLWKMGKKN